MVRCCACCSGVSAGVRLAVVQPRVHEERHVHHVEPGVTGVGERVDHRLQEERAGVLAAADVHDGHVRRDAGDAETVGRRGDRAGDVGAVAAVVPVRPGRRSRGTRTARRPGCPFSSTGMSWVKLRDSARVEVRRDVRVRCRRRRCRARRPSPACRRAAPVRARSDRTDVRPHSWPSSGSMPTGAGSSGPSSRRRRLPRVLLLDGVLVHGRPAVRRVSDGDGPARVEHVRHGASRSVKPFSGAVAVSRPAAALLRVTVPPAVRTACSTTPTSTPSRARTLYSTALPDSSGCAGSAAAGHDRQRPPPTATASTIFSFTHSSSPMDQSSWHDRSFLSEVTCAGVSIPP